MRQPTAPCSAASLGLMPAPGPAVPRDHDRALDRDAQPLEPHVVLGHPVVDEDQRRGDVAVRRVGVVGGKLLGLLARRRIVRERRLAQPGGEAASGARSSTTPLARGGEEDVEGLDPRVEPPGLETAPAATPRSRCRAPSRDGGARGEQRACTRGASPGWGWPGTSPPTRAGRARRRRRNPRIGPSSGGHGTGATRRSAEQTSAGRTRSICGLGMGVAGNSTLSPMPPAASPSSAPGAAGSMAAIFAAGRRGRDAAARTDARRRPQDSHQWRRPLQHPARPRRRGALRHGLIAPYPPQHPPLLATRRTDRLLRTRAGIATGRGNRDGQAVPGVEPRPRRARRSARASRAPGCPVHARDSRHRPSPGGGPLGGRAGAGAAARRRRGGGRDGWTLGADHRQRRRRARDPGGARSHHSSTLRRSHAGPRGARCCSDR